MDKALIGFSTSKNLIGAKAIRYLTESKYSHSFVLLGEIADIHILSESSFPITRMAPLNKYLKKDYKAEVWEISSVDPVKNKKAKQDIMNKVGVWYGLIQIIGYLWIFFFKIFGVKKVNPFQDGEVCSEHVAEYLKFIDYKGVKDIEINSIAPGEILDIFKSDPNCRRIGFSDYDMNHMEWTK